MKKLLALFIALLSATATIQAQTARDITAQERQQMVRYLINRMRPLPIANKGNAQPKYQYYYTPSPVTWNEWAAVLEKKTYGPQGKGNTPMISNRPSELTGLLIHELRMPFFLANKQTIDAACKAGDFSIIIKKVNPGKNEPFYLITTYEGWKQYTKNK